MAQTMFLPTPTLPTYMPNSPDPTPLRMLAFSVAEAALQSDPNSPSLGMIQAGEGKNPRWSGGDWVAPWLTGSVGGNLWDVVERAKERKSSPPLESPPISPASYNFVLPANSSLAASIQDRPIPPPRLPHLQLSKRFPLITRSAEPSPTKSTFSALDQSRPPPEFVPRLSAEEFCVKSKDVSVTRHTRTKSDVVKETVPAPKARSRLPSLAQIQAKMKNPIAGARKVPVQPRVIRTNSDDSVEIKTPTEERPSLAILARRPGTPPTAPTLLNENDLKKDKSEVEPRLASFLRERTSGRIAMSTPPAQLRKPVLKVTPPTYESRPAMVPLVLNSPTQGTFRSPAAVSVVSPTEARFNLAVSTPPAKSSPTLASPVSPTGSYRSSATASPTLSVPIITCTPAPQTVVRDGVEIESDEEEDDVVVFDGEAEEAKERQERERRGKHMLDRLKLRRGSE